MVGPLCTYLGLSTQLCGILYNVVFPWILTFAIVFGILMKSAIFGTDKRGAGVSGLVSLAIGFFITMAVGPAMGAFFATTSMSLMIFLFIILGILLVYGLIAGEHISEKFNTTGKMIAAILAIVIIAWLLLTGGLNPRGLAGGDLWMIIILLALIAGMWWFVSGSADSAGSSEGE